MVGTKIWLILQGRELANDWFETSQLDNMSNKYQNLDNYPKFHTAPRSSSEQLPWQGASLLPWSWPETLNPWYHLPTSYGSRQTCRWSLPEGKRNLIPLELKQENQELSIYRQNSHSFHLPYLDSLQDFAELQLIFILHSSQAQHWSGLFVNNLPHTRGK